MTGPIWIAIEECIAMHELMLAQHGGLRGLRDLGLLESALAKPQNLFVYGKPSHATMAASYAAGIILNHPFLDGNKRTGFLVAAVFLEVNAQVFTASEESVIKYTLGLAAGKLKEKDYADWLKKNSRKSD